MTNRAWGEVSRTSTPGAAAEVRFAGSFGTTLALGALNAGGGGGGLPRHRHGDLRVAPLRCLHGRQLSGSRRLGLAPQGRLNSSSRGVKYPLRLPPPLGSGPRRLDSRD
jgi:hypothetical protein